MAFFDDTKTSFEIWMNGLDAADSAALGVVGFGLMIFAVAALLIQRHLEQRHLKKHTFDLLGHTVPPVLGLRHSRADFAGSKPPRFSIIGKKDPFLSRLERLV